jgi:hypothetical protein
MFTKLEMSTLDMAHFMYGKEEEKACLSSSMDRHY